MTGKENRRTGEKLLLYLHCFCHELKYHARMWPLLQMPEKQTRKVGMHALVSTDELVRKGQARHKATFLQPEYRREGPREEYTFHNRKRHQPHAKRRPLVRYPPQSPVCLPLDTRYSLNRSKQILPLPWVLDIGVNEQRIRLGVHVLHHDLEPVKTARLGDLDVVGEPLDEVLVHDAVGGGEEGEHVRDEGAFGVREAVVPVD